MLIGLLAACTRKKEALKVGPHPSCSVVLVVHNEEKNVVQRVENLLSCSEALGEFELIVFSDGSSDNTLSLLKALLGSKIKIAHSPQRRGKASCLNDAVALASGDIVVFCDARQQFLPDALERLLSRFSDPHIGAVSGRLAPKGADSSLGKGIDGYWKLETFVRRSEALYDSSIGCTGAIYAIRRRLFVPLPPNFILDDVYIPMQVALSGHRVVFEDRALALDPQSLEPRMESARKTRTLAGNFQLLFMFPQWLLPWNNRLWWQLLSHKYLRLLAPAFLLLLLVSNALMLEFPWARLLLGLQISFYGLALCGACGMAGPLFSLPAGFCFLNLMTVRAFVEFILGRATSIWDRKKLSLERKFVSD